MSRTERGSVLALDLGKTGCRAALFEGGERVSESVIPADGTASDSGGVEVALAALRRAVEALEERPARVSAVCAGLAGVFERWEGAQRIASDLRETLEADEALVTSDVLTSYCGALGGVRPGAVIAAGTGAVALAVGDDGSYARTDGWGYLLGDEGGGYEVGRAGLASALRAHDGRGGSEELLRRARERFGTVEGLARRVHGAENPARVVASFAAEVAAAAREGESEACRIWAEAGEELAKTLAAASSRVSGCEAVSWTGGLFSVGGLLREPFERRARELMPGAHIAPPAGDALHGAALLAAAPDLAPAGLMHREGKAAEGNRVEARASVRGDGE